MSELNLGDTHEQSKKLVEHWHLKWAWTKARVDLLESQRHEDEKMINQLKEKVRIADEIINSATGSSLDEVAKWRDYSE